jgi:ABC-type dipeptide/oligopeptide/nickel transport system permease subunit
MNSDTWPGRLVRLNGFRIAAVLLSVVGLSALAPQAIVTLEPGAPSPTDCSLRAEDGTYQDRLAPSRERWFGTDEQGCDVFSRTIHGARSSLVVGVGAAALSVGAGAALGILGAMRGGSVDGVIRRVGDVVLGVPLIIGLILILAVVVPGRRSATHIVLAFAVLLWPIAARITRNAARSIMTAEYIEAARAAGASDVHIAVRHVIPTALPTILPFATSLVGVLIVGEATLSYLGVGLESPAVSWGLMIDRAQPHYATSPQLLLFPGLFLVATVAGFMLLGDALNDSATTRSGT